MLTALQNGKIDISINPLTITAEREQQFDFVQPFYISNSTIAVRKPGRLGNFVLFLKSLFSPNFVSGIILLFFIIFFFGFITWRIERKQNEKHFRQGFRGLLDGIWWSAVTMTTVGYGDKIPRSTSGKVVALTWMFIAIIFISSLTASIASSLTLTQMNRNAQSFEDFKDRKAGCISNTATLQYLESNFFEDIHEFSNVEDGLSALLNHDIDAMLYDEPIIKTKVSQLDLKEQIDILPLKFDAQLYAWGVAPHRDDLLKRLSQFVLNEIESRDWEALLNEFKLSKI